MEIIILGSGSAYGTPMMGGFMHGSDLTDKKNIRLRSSILVKTANGSILVDVTPDIRQQTLNNNVKDIDAILITHGHADHIAGLWEIPRYSHNAEKTIDIHASENTMEYILNMFSFMFSPTAIHPNRKESLSWHSFIPNQPFTCMGCEVMPIDFPHNGINKEVLTTGYLFNKKLLYSTDISGVFDENVEYLTNLDVWIIDCNNGNEARENGHLDLAKIVNLKDKFKPKRMYLTHIQDNIDFEDFSKLLPDGVELVYDEMVIEV